MTETTHNGQEIFWNGHLCEGNCLGLDHDRSTFCLWTRCGKHDVPAGKGYTGPRAPDDIKCDDCRRIWNDENGQFGLGA